VYTVPWDRTGSIPSSDPDTDSGKNTGLLKWVYDETRTTIKIGEVMFLQGLDGDWQVNTSVVTCGSTEQVIHYHIGSFLLFYFQQNKKR
jgi:hypothetical protein